MLIAEDKIDDFDDALAASNDPKCRLCGSYGQTEVFDMGIQAIGSYFPATAGEFVPSAPLRLFQCGKCRLVQLSDGCDHEGIYRSGNYGYRSGQNPQMVAHLTAKAQDLSERLNPGDTVLDIGANDGTFLGAFPENTNRIGFDPTSAQWHEFLPAGVEFVWQLFSSEAYHEMGYPKAKVITSLSMLYDLDDPVGFAREVSECLADDGYWHFEQCYLPTMLATTGYDTVCHEHLTYYSIETIRDLLQRVGMYIKHVELNDANGGSFAVTAAKHPQSLGTVTTPDGMRLYSLGLENLTHERPDSPNGGVSNTWRDRRLDKIGTAELTEFRADSLRHRADLMDLLRYLKSQQRTIGALGASTKGNTLLQFCGLGPDLIEGIGEVNPGKVGRYTPGTHIPIVDEADVLGCDYLLVLPWHFKASFMERYAAYMERGGRLIFPLPEVVVV